MPRGHALDVGVPGAQRLNEPTCTAAAVNCLVTMLRQAIAHAESIRCRSSPCDPVSRPPPVGGARSAPGHAAGTRAVAHRDERIARGGRTTARNETGSARQGGIAFGLRQSAHGEPKPLATRSGTPARVDHPSAAVVAILVALCRRVQGLAKTDRPALRLRASHPGYACLLNPGYARFPAFFQPSY